MQTYARIEQHPLPLRPVRRGFRVSVVNPMHPPRPNVRCAKCEQGRSTLTSWAVSGDRTIFIGTKHKKETRRRSSNDTSFQKENVFAFHDSRALALRGRRPTTRHLIPPFTQRTPHSARPRRYHFSTNGLMSISFVHVDLGCVCRYQYASAIWRRAANKDISIGRRRRRPTARPASERYAARQPVARRADKERDSPRRR